ncbi:MULTISPECIES: cyclic lactone autoinducer peptide [Bacillus cereus group]|uniref:cyclic lactone autoinducer peptide n=1 Tax=Bacillus cereus group TaxID=86661 RepID=UPI001CFC8666|nr:MULTISPECIES: cyclic lactone autoinducer peptide [Bacillus cereus group]USK97357.1 cyclic lactone autoinducer peptide [Bacillus tropicus]WHT85035.1 cyclic lactone autoinducer peptide [Bacillus cereus]WHT90175.1 cyclic lactone autoinducer peptide [Bacillus cereus]
MNKLLNNTIKYIKHLIYKLSLAIGDRALENCCFLTAYEPELPKELQLNEQEQLSLQVNNEY